MIQGEAKCSLKICVSILSWGKKEQKSCCMGCFLSLCDYVSIVKGPSVSHKTAKIKLQFVSVFRNALKKSIRLPLYNKIHSAHVGGPKKKKKLIVSVFARGLLPR